MGEKLAAYVRPSAAYIASLAPKGKAKGKGKANGSVVEVDLAEDSPDAVTYEVYKVSQPVVQRARVADLHHTGDMEYTWIQRVSPSDAALHPALYRGR